MPAPPPPDLDEPVWLRVPADVRYVGVVRVAVSAFVLRLGLPPSTVEDLCLAVDEALVLLLGADQHGPSDADGAEPSVLVTVGAAGERPPIGLELRLDPPPSRPLAGERLERFAELIPASVAIDVAEPSGRVVLHHPA